MNITTIKIACQDGFELTATAYFPTKLKAALMIAPATGIKRIFYNSFASYLAENGYGKSITTHWYDAIKIPSLWVQLLA